MNAQPIDSVEWVDPATLRANDYNPNKVPKQEMRLLRTSIIEDGWTQPIVILTEPNPDGTYDIVDGFHRWTLGSTDKEVRAITDGLVPVVRLDADQAHRRMSTVRHNRARGNHYVLAMADIVSQLIASGISEDELVARLGMEPEEVRRLAARGNMLERGSDTEFTNAWVPEMPEPVTP